MGFTITASPGYLPPSGLDTDFTGGGGSQKMNPTNAAITADVPAVVTLPSATMNEEEALLDRLGLSYQIVESTSGKIAADNMATILSTIDDDYMALTLRLAVSFALLRWQAMVTEELRDEIFKKHYFKALEVIRFTMTEADDHPKNIPFTTQKLAEHVSLFLFRESMASMKRRDMMQNDVVRVIEFAVSKGVGMTDPPSPGIENPMTVRCETMKNLLRCLPVKGKLLILLHQC